jgi:hypothetical protein
MIAFFFLQPIEPEHRRKKVLSREKRVGVCVVILTMSSEAASAAVATVPRFLRQGTIVQKKRRVSVVMIDPVSGDEHVVTPAAAAAVTALGPPRQRVPLSIMEYGDVV